MALDNSRHHLQPLEMRVSETEHTDHRKRKRNRMRASCLNCYASKRKCDKKRPCARCVRLGTTGLCVYETEDPFSGDQACRDEINRLRRRVAELESLARELRNNPHPRWTAPGGVHHDPEYVHFHPKPGHRVEDTHLRPAANTNSHPAVRAYGRGHDKSRDNPSAQHSEPGHSLSSVSWDATIQALGKADDSSSACDCNDHLYNSDDISADGISSSRPNTSDGVRSPSRSSYETDHPNRVASVGGLEQFLPPPVVECNENSVVDRGERSCNCIEDQAAFAPLVNLSVALRSSREALEYLHPTGVNCPFYSRIILLENHIFSLSPPEGIYNYRPFGAFGASSSSMNTDAPHPYPSRIASHVHHLVADRNSHDQSRGLEPHAYLGHPFVHAVSRK